MQSVADKLRTAAEPTLQTDMTELAGPSFGASSTPAFTMVQTALHLAAIQDDPPLPLRCLFRLFHNRAKPPCSPRAERRVQGPVYRCCSYVWPRTPRALPDGSGASDAEHFRREWFSNMLFRSYGLGEGVDVPEVEGVDGWLGLMKSPRCQWGTLWGACCVAAIRASEAAVL